MELFDVRKPPGNATLTPEQTVRLIKAAWYDLKGRQNPPDKFVVLVDADAQNAAAAKPFQDAVANLADIPAGRFVAVADRHLEAWFFADAEGLRGFLKRAPGHVDTSDPDNMVDPKRQLMKLLQSQSRVYTARIAGQIAESLNPQNIEGRSPSFASFVKKLKNGRLDSSPSHD